MGALKNPAHETELLVSIPANGIKLEGSLVIPARARGIVLFAHGSGSSRHSARNNFVAEVLHKAAIGTLLMDLLTTQEEDIDRYSRQYRFDIPLLGRRVVDVLDWTDTVPSLSKLPAGCFGASTGAAAALIAAAERASRVRAVVSRGGRPDLAADALPRVEAPTLLIVGALDHDVLVLNDRAMRAMRAPAKLEIVPGATHLFEEPGTLAIAAGLARDWFLSHLAPDGRPPV